MSDEKCLLDPRKECSGVKWAVDELKGKSGKTWEDIKSKAIGWAVVLVLAIVAAALGLSKYV